MSKGFSLIELLIGIAIVSILAAVSGNVFSDNILKSRRQSAQNELFQHTLLQEQFRLTHGRYGSAKELGLDDTDDYLFSVEVNNGVAFSISATAQNNQLKDSKCSKLTINQSMQRFPDGCW